MKAVLRTLNFVIAASVGNYLANVGTTVFEGHLIIPASMGLYFAIEYLDDRLDKREKRND